MPKPPASTPRNTPRLAPGCPLPNARRGHLCGHFLFTTFASQFFITPCLISHVYGSEAFFSFYDTLRRDGKSASLRQDSKNLNFGTWQIICTRQEEKSPKNITPKNDHVGMTFQGTFVLGAKRRQIRNAARQSCSHLGAPSLAALSAPAERPGVCRQHIPLAGRSPTVGVLQAD